MDFRIDAEQQRSREVLLDKLHLYFRKFVPALAVSRGQFEVYSHMDNAMTGTAITLQGWLLDGHKRVTIEPQTTLPIEYELKYGTARGNADLADFVNQTPSLSFVRIESCLTHEVALSVRIGQTSPPFIASTVDFGLTERCGTKLSHAGVFTIRFLRHWRANLNNSWPARSTPMRGILSRTSMKTFSIR